MLCHSVHNRCLLGAGKVGKFHTGVKGKLFGIHFIKQVWDKFSQTDNTVYLALFSPVCSARMSTESLSLLTPLWFGIIFIQFPLRLVRVPEANLVRERLA